jgi:RNA polymerase sigma factor (TIGR02999 family)
MNSADQPTNPRANEHRAEPLRDAVYRQLRAMAQRQMAGERPNHTLSATALVHEVYLKMSGDLTDRGAFFHAAAEAMRRILIDHARASGAAKRGGSGNSGGSRTNSFESLESLSLDGNSEEVVALDEAFLSLEKDDARAAEVVRLRFYAGLSVDQSAEVLGVSRRSVLRDWMYARAFLRAALDAG